MMLPFSISPSTAALRSEPAPNFSISSLVIVESYSICPKERAKGFFRQRTGWPRRLPVTTVSMSRAARIFFL